MSRKHPNSRIIYFLLSLAGALSLLPSGSSAQERVLFIDMYRQCGESERGPGDRDDVDMEIDGIDIKGQLVETGKVTAPIGEHKLRIVVKASGTQDQATIIKEIKFSHTSAGTTQVLNPNSADATFTFNSADMPLYAYANVEITLQKCGSASTAEKEVAVAAVSEDCKDFNWEGSSIKFGSEFRLNKYGIAHGKTVLDPGTYKVSFRHPTLAPAVGDENPATANPNYTGLAKISRVEVYRPFPKQELVGTYPADENGVATVPLDAGLWKDKNVPYIKVYVEKICDLRFATVEFFVGQVEINFDSATSKPIPAESGMNLFKSDLIKLGPGSSIQLKSQGGIYQINISVPQSGTPAQVNISSLITAGGRRFIQLLTESTTRIEIKRLVIKKPPQPPPAPNEPPELVREPEPQGVIVENPTLKTTEKKTNYMVSYDATTRVTTVGVEEGEVEITPTNTSLPPFTLAASQQVQVTESSVGAITSYSGSGGNTGRILLYIGIGLASMLILAALFYFFRRHHRLAMQPAFYPPAVNPAGWNALDGNVPQAGANPNSRRCPNPQCGKESPADEKVCRHCGALLMQK